MLSVRCLSCLSCLSVTLVYCGHTVGRIKMKLGAQVGLGPGHIVLGGDPALPPLKGHNPHPQKFFGPYLLRPNGCMDQNVIRPCVLLPNGWMNEGGTWHGGRPQPRRLCVRCGPSPLPQKGRSPLPNFRSISVVAKRLHASKCHLV